MCYLDAKYGSTRIVLLNAGEQTRLMTSGPAPGRKNSPHAAAYATCGCTRLQTFAAHGRSVLAARRVIQAVCVACCSATLPAAARGAGVAGRRCPRSDRGQRCQLPRGFCRRVTNRPQAGSQSRVVATADCRGRSYPRHRRVSRKLESGTAHSFNAAGQRSRPKKSR